jgi:hypothetical protein
MHAAVTTGALLASVIALAACNREPAQTRDSTGPAGHTAGSETPAGPRTGESGALDAGCGDDASLLAGPRVGATAATIRVVNKYCPLLVGQSVGADRLCPPDLTRTLDGQSIGFCDKACVEAWDQMSDERRREILRETLALESDPMR